jgi:hypothetical protein
MSMTKLFYGLAALPLVAGVAYAEPPKSAVKQPLQLNEQQMDKITAGHAFRELKVFNSGAELVSIYTPSAATVAPGIAFGADNGIACGPDICYLNISTRSLSVASVIFGGPISAPSD